MFAIVDIETCGPKFAYERGRIIDICILLHDGLQVTDKFSTLINPDCHIGSFYTKLSGITNEMVKDAPRFHEVAKDILQFTEGRLFVAHNASFDYNFIKDEFASLGFRFKRDTLCTVRLSRKLLPGKPSYSLGNLCESLGITIYDRHRAEGDAVATAKLLDLLMQVKTQSGTHRSQSVAQIMTTRRDNIKTYILDKVPSSCGVYYLLNREKQIMYIGKSVDMYARAQQHFNADLRKSREMLQHVYDADFTETGSELISLLLESEEIKKHQPPFNSARKRDVFTHCLDLEERHGVLGLRIVPYEESRRALQVFTSYAAARERLDQWIEEHDLCLQYCGLTEEGSVCFHHQIKKCHGICAGLEEAEDYNRRVQRIADHFAYPWPSFLIVDRGRKPGEQSFVFVHGNRYAGYGYLDEGESITDAESVYGYLSNRTYYPDAEDLVKAWLRQKKRQIVRL